MTQLNFKYILWILIFFLTFILFNSWENEKYLNKELNEKETKHQVKKHLDVANDLQSNDDKEIVVETNLISAKISLSDGNFSFLSLKKYYDDLNKERFVSVLKKSKDDIHFVKCGFLDTELNVNNASYVSEYNSYIMHENESELIVVLKQNLNNKVVINKVYIFKNYSYEIEVKIYIKNLSDDKITGRFYGCIGKSYKKNDGWFSSRSYDGAALYTNDKIYKKLSFSDIDKTTYVNKVKGGWVAFVENYFLSTWIPENDYTYIYTAERNDNLYILKYITDQELSVLPNEYRSVSTKLFIGPKIKDYLSTLHKGLDLSIDYGFFWPIALSVFLLLSKIFLFVNNWGLSIIIITCMIKLLFYNLSAMSYKSLKEMKNLQPRLESLKERYKDDKKELNQAVLELYKTEKVNPLSGCLPILIQIPVFISLYCVLLESVELRHSPFVFWISDLSSKDMYYVLPIIMSLTMFIQQKLNPPVQDALQRKIILFMPFVFLFVFLQFPSGLVLYWVVNNILSIFQQWLITRHT